MLIDERLGRKIAAIYGFKLRGLLGILITAKQQKLISTLKPILDRLIVQAGFQVSPALYARTLEDLQLMQAAIEGDCERVDLNEW